MWREIGNIFINFRDISAVQLISKEDKKVVITMNNNRNFTINEAEGFDPDAIYNKIADLLELIVETDDIREKERTELLNSILSELKLISQNLRRL